MSPNAFHPARDRNGAHRAAHAAITDFTALGITLPRQATTAHAALTAHETRAPQPTISVRDLYVNNATDKSINEALAYNATHNDRRNAWTQARADLGIATIRALINNADELHPQLASLAKPIIENITAAAQLNDGLTALVRDGRTKDAELLAHAEHHTTQLEHLYALYADYCTPPDIETEFGGYTATHWSNPRTVHGHDKGDTQWEAWRAGIRAGGQLWYPTWQQAADTANAALTQWRRENPRQPAVGGITAFTTT